MARRSLWPREHGAYAQLGIPLVTALAVRLASPSALALAAGACLAFLANEPLLVLLGHRGARVREALGASARRRLAVTVGGGALATVAGLYLAPASSLGLAAIAAVPALAMITLALTRSAHSLWGELVAAIALPGAAAPVAAASGLPWQTAVALWLAWSIGYASSVVAVHEILRRNRRALPGLALAALAIATASASIYVRELVVAVPLVGLGAFVAIRLPPARRVRAIGVALVVASSAAAVLALAVVSA
jgi:YwiC-like protein